LDQVGGVVDVLLAEHLPELRHGRDSGFTLQHPDRTAVEQPAAGLHRLVHLLGHSSILACDRLALVAVQREVDPAGYALSERLDGLSLRSLDGLESHTGLALYDGRVPSFPNNLGSCVDQ